MHPSKTYRISTLSPKPISAPIPAFPPPPQSAVFSNALANLPAPFRSADLLALPPALGSQVAAPSRCAAFDRRARVRNSPNPPAARRLADRWRALALSRLWRVAGGGAI